MKINALSQIIIPRIYSKKEDNIHIAGKKENFNPVVFSNSYFYPVNFTSRKRTANSTIPSLRLRSSNFLPNRFQDLPCCSCGKKMLTKKKYYEIKQELENIDPNKYLEYLGQYKEYMRPVEESVYNQLCELSKKEGETDLRTLIVSLRENELPELQKKQMKQVKKMNKFAKYLPLNEKKELLKKTLELENEIYKKNSIAPFRRKIMLDNICNIKISNKKKYEKLVKIAEGFPSSKDLSSAWIVKYSGSDKENKPWNSLDIAQRFLMSSVATTDHILAYTIDPNHNDITNYFGMHSGCNENKQNKTFMHWLHEDKENRIKYMKDYFLGVQNLIDSKKINKPMYKNYVAYATYRIYKLSKDTVKLFDDNEFPLTDDEKALIDNPKPVNNQNQKQPVIMQ